MITRRTNAAQLEKSTLFLLQFASIAAAAFSSTISQQRATGVHDDSPPPARMDSSWIPFSTRIISLRAKILILLENGPKGRHTYYLRQCY